MERYDLIVIGGGPGGYVASIRGAQLGKRVALVEKNRVGGTCLNRGCIPTKVLMYATERLREIDSCPELGITLEAAKIDFGRLHERKSEVVEKLVSGVEGLIKANGIDYYSGVGILEGAHLVSVVPADTSEDSISIEGENVILATGSTPILPPIKGIDSPGVVTSDDILIGTGLETESLIIIGGGVIGVEIASIYNALGTDVTIIEAMDRILPTLDKEISQNLSMILKKRGIKINTGARVEEIKTSEGGELQVDFLAKEELKSLSAKNVLVAIGRKPNTDGLVKIEGLETERGFVKTSESGLTSIPGVYAVGDIVLGGIQLAHAASAEGINAVEHMFSQGEEMCGKNLEAIPSGIYTDPEIASVGITEAQAKEQGLAYLIGKAMTGANGKTLIESGDRGYVKLIFVEGEKSSPVLKGAQMVCKRATDMIGGLALAVSSGLTLDELSSVVWPHPTFSETIGEAVEDAIDGAIHAMPRRK